MTETEIEAGGEAPRKKKKSKLLLVAGAMALLAGGGGFAAVQAGLLDSVLAMIGLGGEAAMAGSHGGEGGEPAAVRQIADASYVFVEPMVITLGPESHARHLKVVVAVDVEPGRESEVADHMPRIVDTLQGLLRAVDERELAVPMSMERLRAQMLRRVALVTPPGAARDLLIQEFVIN